MDIIVVILLFIFVCLCVFLYRYKGYSPLVLPLHRRGNNSILKVMENAQECILCFDLSGKCIYANPYTFTVFHRPPKEVIRDAERFFEQWMSKKSSGSDEMETKILPLDLRGKKCYFEVEIKKIKNEKEKIYGYQVTVTDKTTELTSHRKEQYDATHDTLTQVLKREVFYSTASDMLHRNPYIQWVLVCTDITNFKLINDIFGEQVGDQVLQKQAAFWKQLENENALVGRIISDRFAILLPKNEFDEQFFLERMDQLQEIDHIKNFRLHVTMGVYVVEDLFENVRIMCDKALLANASIDDNFQEHIAYYDKNMLEQLIHEKQIVNDFDYSLEKEKFCMYFQPQFNAERKLVGAEALVRWKHPELGMLYPDQFVKIYERAGLIYELDRYVWELACAKLKEWHDRGCKDLCISVNISTKDFYYADIYAVLTKLVRQYEVEPSCLNLEITESAVIHETEYLRVIQKLRAYGFCIEIDDFGSGYSSLHLLTDIKADYLKIDMLFLSKTENMQRSRSILQSVIDMAKQLEMKVIAEGVENEEQLEQLMKDGCDCFQGYYFSEPVSVEEFEEKYHIGEF